MSKIAMFGGSFNPVHNGHIGIVDRMIEEFGLDKVYVIPTFDTPLKDNTPMLSASHRLNMCRLAYSLNNKVIVSDIEIKREGKSFTIDTLKQLKEMNPDDNIFLIVGADSFMQLELWYDVEEIFRIATILTVSRGEVSADDLYIRKQMYKEKFNANVHIIEEPIVKVSSTEIRELIKNDGNISQLLPQNVIDYIKTNNLYGY